MAIITETDNFRYISQHDQLFTFNDINASIARAHALAATCESDLKTMQQWFGDFGGFGPDNKVNIYIGNLKELRDASALGVNFGYHSKETGKETKILIHHFAPSAFFAARVVDDPDAAARAVFVAEMSEILMDQRTQHLPKTTNAPKRGFWNSRDSMGEALSTVCEALLHPEGYYEPNNLGPRIFTWLNLDLSTIGKIHYRENWINKTDGSDQHFWSFGCGIVFLYYLMHQRNISLENIIANSGATFEDTYRNLTGRTGAWDEFMSLLNLYFPFSVNNFVFPKSDNLFPLPRLASLKLEPSTVKAGDVSKATLTLDAKYPAADLQATVISTDDEFATVPATPVIIKAGSESADFQVQTPSKGGVFPPKHATIVANLGGAQVSAVLTIKSTVEGGTLRSITLNPSTVIGGNVSRATLTLREAVPTATMVGLAAVENEVAGPMPHGVNPPSFVTVSPQAWIDKNETQTTVDIRTSELAPRERHTVKIIARALETHSAELTVESA